MENGIETWSQHQMVTNLASLSLLAITYCLEWQTEHQGYKKLKCVTQDHKESVKVLQQKDKRRLNSLTLKRHATQYLHKYNAIYNYLRTNKKLAQYERGQLGVPEVKLRQASWRAGAGVEYCIERNVEKLSIEFLSERRLDLSHALHAWKTSLQQISITFPEEKSMISGSKLRHAIQTFVNSLNNDNRFEVLGMYLLEHGLSAADVDTITECLKAMEEEQAEELEDFILTYDRVYGVFGGVSKVYLNQ